VEEKRRRFLAFVIVIFYISFIVCGAVAWHLKNYFWSYPSGSVVPAIIETFVPFFDFFVLVSSIFLIRRHREGDKPSFRYGILFVLNVALFILHLVIMIIMAVWIGRRSSYNHYYWSARGPNVAGLILYSSATMVLFKILLLIAALRSRSLRITMTEGMGRIPTVITGQDYRYDQLTRDVDEDAAGVDSVRNSRDEGRVYLS